MSRAADLLAAAAGPIVEQIVIPSRRERARPVPQPYADGATGAWLEAMTGTAGKLWRHQSLALEKIGRGSNVVVATGTASGKSLVFMTPIMHELLNGAGKAIVFYPQKALGGDQLGRFRAALTSAGLDPRLVGEINGDVEAPARDEVLQRCRVILATPDVIHAWLMRQVQSPRIREFLRHLKLVVLDEAHVLEGIFGSNVSYLFRRIRSAQAEILGGEDKLQWIAATATIRDPGGHLRLLTGRDFSVVGDEENGAPFHGLTLMHISGPDRGIGGEKLLAEVCSSLATTLEPQALIAFADSRQGVEHVAQYVGRDDVLPYRGGYEADDRRAIEAMLRDNELRGIIATSALELGIDIPQFEIGINLGIPQTRKALRQRIGRIGRTMPGAFAVIAPATAFAQLGGTFEEYVKSEVEPSRLYLDNKCIQLQAARCLIDECADATSSAPPLTLNWPAGFKEMFALARPGAIRTADLDQVLAIGADSPHNSFPLRAMREAEFALRNIRSPSERIGKIDLEKALRETYPGATYYHRRRAFRVVQWRTTAYEHSIMLEPAKGRLITHPMLTSSVSVSTEASELLDGHLLSGDNGDVAEITLRVVDSVEGYASGNATHCYRDLRVKDSRLCRRFREFATTGVLLRINEKWFAGSSLRARKVREEVADALAAVLAREHNIAPSEIRTAHSKISVFRASGPQLIDDAIVIFDNVVGGLRLSSPLFTKFGELLDRLERAASIATEDALLASATVKRLRNWFEGLQSQGAPDAGPSAPTPPPPGAGSARSQGITELEIFAPGSLVGVRLRGSIEERRLVGPELKRIGDDDVLGYQYEARGETRAWVPHERVEPLGAAWRRALWSPQSGGIRNIAA